MNMWPLIEAASDCGRLDRNAVYREDDNVEGACNWLLEEMLAGHEPNSVISDHTI